MDITEATEIVRKYLESRCQSRNGLWKFDVLLATRDDGRGKIAIKCRDNCLAEFTDHIHEVIVDQQTKQIVAFREVTNDP